MGCLFRIPFILRVKKELNIKTALIKKDIKNKILGETNGRDKLSILELSLNYRNYLWKGVNFFELKFSRGLKHFLGGMGNNEVKSTRFGAEGDFSKVEFNFVRYQYLPKKLSLKFALQTQWSDDILPSSEEFILGGVGTVRGFEPAEYSGDKGFATSLELGIPLKTLKRLKIESAKFITFWDWGAVFKNKKLPGEYSYKYLSSIGVGLRLGFPRNLEVSTDLANPQKDGKLDIGYSYLYTAITWAF